MFISSVILFAFKNWKIAARYGFASSVHRPKRCKANYKKILQCRFYLKKENDVLINKKLFSLQNFIGRFFIIV